LEGDREKSLEATNEWLFGRDPEAHVVVAANLMGALGESERTLSSLSLALDNGFWCYQYLLGARVLDHLRPDPRFAELVNRAAALDLQARKAFVDNGGNRLLGVQVEDDG
jgi:hypothetical protein